MKIVTIVGARPQFVKAAAVSRVIRQEHEEKLVHTGQHYDFTMSGIFFGGLKIPEPDFNLEVGSGRHGEQTGAMLAGIEEILMETEPDRVIVYGDTNSTLAGALAASKLHVPIIHIEAGLRSFNRRMPEEINRLMTDHLSSILVCPSETSVKNLENEGIVKNVHLLGDVMYDVLLWAKAEVEARQLDILSKLNLSEGKYRLVTIHRSENTDDPERLANLVTALNDLPGDVVFPIHPRTRKVLKERGFKLAANVKMIDPVGYLEMLTLASGAAGILTDSGGLQKEAYWLQVPCLTLRDETEWVETVEVGWNKLVGADPLAIGEAVRSWVPPRERPLLYGQGKVAEQMLSVISDIA